jgi:hypothetical protein
LTLWKSKKTRQREKREKKRERKEKRVQNLKLEELTLEEKRIRYSLQ